MKHIDSKWILGGEIEENKYQLKLNKLTHEYYQLHLT